MTPTTRFTDGSTEPQLLDQTTSRWSASLLSMRGAALSALALTLTSCGDSGEDSETAAEVEDADTVTAEDSDAEASPDDAADDEPVEHPDDELDEQNELDELEEYDDLSDEELVERYGEPPETERHLLEAALDDDELPEGWTYSEGPTAYLSEDRRRGDSTPLDFEISAEDAVTGADCDEAMAELRRLIVISTGLVESTFHIPGEEDGMAHIKLFTAEGDDDVAGLHADLPDACPTVEGDDGLVVEMQPWDDPDVGGFWYSTEYEGMTGTAGVAAWDGDGVHLYARFVQEGDEQALEEHLTAQIDALEEIDFR
ncbi:hypothetical protein [Nesterenkonia sp. PF2B19]|uniref:hypothetical protein n=1 Tax=Nesterenkonia sp. PF2B19 TaxID=1881858 RepID=UPI0008733A80|nr:hypothetical protein [Nesterenkonia sp. PF2B19]OSM43432.1 hypothetical protein BCY76_008475 [Nesterenkonia sp. PF2B19]